MAAGGVGTDCVWGVKEECPVEDSSACLKDYENTKLPVREPNSGLPSTVFSPWCIWSWRRMRVSEGWGGSLPVSMRGSRRLHYLGYLPRYLRWNRSWASGAMSCMKRGIQGRKGKRKLVMAMGFMGTLCTYIGR